MTATVLTPNQRLAATLTKQYQQEQLQQGHSCWHTPDILPIFSWVMRTWEQSLAQHPDNFPLILTPNQELILWEEIITQSPESESLLKVSDLAKQARSAWSLLKQWQLNFTQPSFALTENSQAFQKWAQQFALRCLQENWIDSSSVVDHLILKINVSQVKLPPEIMLYNFTELTPQYLALLEACEKFTTVSSCDFSAEPSSSLCHSRVGGNDTGINQFLGLPDEKIELETMARWAKNILEKNPDARIGCIADQLEEKRDNIIAIFTDVFEGTEKFNISAGKPLTAYPIIQSALRILDLPVKELPYETFSGLLLSPFVGYAESEMIKRIQLDSDLRRRNMTTVSWLDLIKGNSCPHLIKQMERYLAQRDQEPASATMSTWVSHFAQLLESIGWPGEQSLNSAEYQVVQEWLELLRDTAALDYILLTTLNYHKALHYLTALAARTFFQPQSPEAPIQILGQLEGAGIPFDYLWVTGLDDTAWPPSPSPNPFIPHELQKNFHMPNATAERQLAYSLKLTEQFKNSASHTIFSYLQHREEEELRPSPLIANLPEISLAEVSLAAFTSNVKKIQSSRSFEAILDNQAPPIPLEKKISGGTAILEMQAACSFKAFAKLRLNAKSCEESQAGLPAMHRGSIIHRVLELFWREMGTQQKLLQLKENELDSLVQKHLTNTLGELAPYINPQSFYYDLVNQRLKQLLLGWFALEKTRPPFKVIAQELKKEIEVGGMSFSIRVDRIDELSNGEKLIIDYKTKKKCEIKNWFGERLEEPQLPLYCITDTENLVGIAFAQLHMAETGLQGIAHKAIDIPGIIEINEKSKADASHWQAQLQEWQKNLTRLVTEFYQGIVITNPKDEQTCTRCDLQTLCRIHEKE
jgi:ATP-dependent helicase/nuclease subunit B